jgi:lysophospholipase L1-like esterase
MKDMRSGSVGFPEGRLERFKIFPHTLRRAWQGLFAIAFLGSGFWFLKNLLTGHFRGHGSYFFPVAMTLLACVTIIYIVAFRSNEETFVNLNLSLAALIIVGAMSEAGIRIWDRYDPIFQPPSLAEAIPGKGEVESYSFYKPGSLGSTHGHPVRINSFGFRGPDWDIQKAPNGFRILALGDSFTFGQGVDENETYASLLREKLNGMYPEKTIEVLNLGVQGYEAIDEMKLLEKVGPLLHPDLVLVGFYENDVVLEHLPWDERWRIPLPEGLKTSLLAGSKVLRWLSTRYDHLLVGLGIRLDASAWVDRYYEPASKEWKEFVAAYGRMYEWTKENQIPPPLVGLFYTQYSFNPKRPSLTEADSESDLQVRHIRQVQEALKTFGIPTVDYLPLFRQHGGENLMVSKWDAHPNALAHKLYAEGFLNSLVALNLIH